MLLKESPVAAVIGVKDLGRSKEFYEGKLGLNASGTKANNTSAFYDCGDGTKLLLYETEAPLGQATVAGFSVANADAAVAELHDKGVDPKVFEGIPGMDADNGIYTDDAGNRNFFLIDPDGNAIAISELKG